MSEPTIVDDEVKRTKSGWDSIILFLGTGLYSGLVSPYFATVGALLGIPLAIGLHAWLPWHIQGAAIVILVIASVPICQRSAVLLGRKDPREVVLDEIVTIPIAYFLVPALSWQVIVVGFLLHRVFDITKALGVNQLQYLPGGWGIVADDVLAGTYAGIALHLLLHFHIIA